MRLLLLLLITTLIGFGLVTVRTSRPNVVLILTDDQGWGDLSRHGNPNVQTPVLDSLAGQGAQFERFYVSPLCAPTRASLLTGRYHLRTGTVSVTNGMETMRAEETTLAEVFRGNGYRTGIFGKWHNGEHYPNNPAGQGFDDFTGFCAGHWSNYFNTELEQNGKSLKTKGFITDVLTDAALSFIGKNGKQPFFCYLSLNAPHSPHQVPDPYFNRSKAKGLDNEQASIYGMVENVDDNIGRLLRRLDELQLSTNTIVIFMTDNGPNGQRFNGGMKGIKGSVDEGGMRVPCFVRWPGHIRPGTRISSLAAHIDWLPTLVELCGLNQPKTLPVDGQSLASLLLGKPAKQPERMLFSHVAFSEKTISPQPGTVRIDRYRLVWKGKIPELYDMQLDPQQRRNVASEQPEQMKILADAYERWFADVTRTLTPAPPVPVGHPKGGTVELKAPESRFTGAIRFKEGHGWAHDWLTNWTSPADSIRWQLTAHQPTRYTVWLTYTCPLNSVGSTVQISVGGRSVAGIISRPFDPPLLPSPDRVMRKEAYEKTWTRVRIGTLTIPKGPQSLVLRATSVSGDTVAEINSVVLEPAP